MWEFNSDLGYVDCIPLEKHQYKIYSDDFIFKYLCAKYYSRCCVYRRRKTKCLYSGNLHSTGGGEIKFIFYILSYIKVY